MLRSPWFRISLTIAVSAAVVWFATRDRPKPLLPIPEVPRPEVVIDPSATALSFAGVDDPFPHSPAELRDAHNQIAQDLQTAVDAWRDGKAPLRRAEQIEMRLLVARNQLGAMDDPAFHSALALLFAREAERLEKLSRLETRSASEQAVADARLYVERERYLAGEDNDYAAQRAARMAHYRDRQSLQTMRSRKLTVLQDELAEFADEFPEPSPSPAPSTVPG